MLRFGRLFAIWVLVVSCALLLHGAEAAVSSTAASRYVLKNPDQRTVVVFVHGWREDFDDAWKSPKTKADWPELLRTDPTFAGMDVYVASYPTPGFGPSMTVGELTELLYKRMLNDGVFNYEKIIFVAHSMGGLTVRQMLLNHRDVIPKVKLLFFLAVPTEGSDLATAARHFLNNPLVNDLLPIGEFNTYVGNTMNSWVASNIRLETVCGYEKIATYQFIVVPQASAIALCQNYLPIPADHSGISKPGDITDDIHVFLRTTVKNVSNANSGIVTVDIRRIVDASSLSCDATGAKIDNVAIDDELSFVDSPPARYLARAETSPKELVQFIDPQSGIAMPTDRYVSGDLTYHSAQVPVVNGSTKVRYQWTNAHSGNELEVWSRPAALLRNFEATIRLPPNVVLTPKSITPSSSTCTFSGNGRIVKCKELGSRDVPIVITWSWDVWKLCNKKGGTRASRPIR